MYCIFYCIQPSKNWINGEWILNVIGGLIFGLCADMKVRPIHMCHLHILKANGSPIPSPPKKFVMPWFKQAQ